MPFGVMYAGRRLAGFFTKDCVSHRWRVSSSSLTVEMERYALKELSEAQSRSPVEVADGIVQITIRPYRPGPARQVLMVENVETSPREAATSAVRQSECS
jgi:hypothetical protein